MSEYTVSDVVNAAISKDMIGLKQAVHDQLASRAADAVDALYPEVGAAMMNPQDNVEDFEDEVSDEELELDDSEEETDEDV